MNKPNQLQYFRFIGDFVRMSNVMLCLTKYIVTCVHVKGLTETSWQQCTATLSLVSLMFKAVVVVGLSKLYPPIV